LAGACNLSSRSKTESVEVTEGSKTASSQSPEETLSSEASTALQEIVDLLATVEGPGAYRQYKLERINGELVFRQTEIGRRAREQDPVRESRRGRIQQALMCFQKLNPMMTFQKGGFKN
jgi:hypothetical protein